MTYYKTGEFAKIASLSIRTIRYYDEIGLLKPTYIADNGYRMYSDEDVKKLQKIVSLKSLGFSLDDIITMTLDDDYITLSDTLSLQEKMLERKIKALELQKESVHQTLKNIKQNNDVDWMNIMHDIQFSSMENELVEQYKNATNVDIRIKLHEKYSVNPIQWFNWLYDLYQINKKMTVLEVGCGNGELWAKNMVPNAKITLSDISEGMLDDAKSRLGKKYKYVCCDVQALPFDDNTFDLVIANHVLFYVKDINVALTEIKRVLKPGGKLFASAYGPNHMKEITQLVKEYNPRINLSDIILYDQFGLHNASDIIKPIFHNCEIKEYDDHLFVTDPNDLVYYMLSCHGNQSEYLSKDFNKFSEFITKKTKKGLKITKEAGVIIAVK